MFHPNTERLIDYWRRCKGQAFLPARASIDPGAFTDLLPQVFIMGRQAPGVYVMRLSGGFVADLHGRELKGEIALSLWARGDRIQVQSALEIARRSPDPVVITAEARALDAPPAVMEVMLAPLVGKSGEADRYLGLYQPITSMRQLEDRPVRELGVQAISSYQTGEPHLRLAAAYGERIA
jgi:hypothetical protein